MRHSRGILERVKSGFVYFDGGMGTLLQERGLMPGELPERWNVSHPDVITDIHRAYLDAGCNILTANTFGANNLKYSSSELKSLITAAIKNAAAACTRDDQFVALDIGPTGKLLEPLGDLGFERAVSIFAETVRCGAESGADLIIIETMNDSYEMKAAVLAARENCDLPVFATCAYDESGKLMTGASPAAMVALLEGLRVDALGINCSLGPEQMMPVISQLLEYSSLPVIVNPNAGLPRVENGRTVYDIGPEKFAEAMLRIAGMGARVLGGCCGTTPEHMRAMIRAVSMTEPVPLTQKDITLVSSYTGAVRFGGRPVLIGERINPTGKKRFQQALRDGDMQYILNQAIEQQDKGAHVLDVNVGLPEIDEPAVMDRVVRELQTVCDLPLQIDTSDPAAMEIGLRHYNGKAMVNSVNGKAEVMHAVFPLVKKYGGLVVGLLLDEDGIPETAEGRIAIADKIYRTAAGYGIAKKDIILDALAMTISTDDRSGLVTLGAIRRITEEYHGLTSLGVSNISFGLPERGTLNSTFFTMAMTMGLSAAIMNPLSLPMMESYYSFCALHGYDPNCTAYIEFATGDDMRRRAELIKGGGPGAPGGTGGSGIAGGGAGGLGSMGGGPGGSGTGGEGVPGQGAPGAGSTGVPGGAGAGAAGAGITAAGAVGNGSRGRMAEDPLYYAIKKGLKEKAGQAARQALEAGAEPLELIDSRLVPALDEVGRGFEKKTVFLPQLLMSAEAAKEGFAVLRSFMAEHGSPGEKKGKFVLATVKGDIHDIGKNIVKALLENYDFDVIDLGRDVDPEAVVEATVREHAPLVGLSALMTTTVPAMEETIKQLRDGAPWCRVVVGGAVLTQKYADMIGADHYARDAMETVRYAEEVVKELGAQGA